MSLRIAPLFFLLMLLGPSLGYGAADDELVPIDRIVAVVDDNIVTFSELAREVFKIRNQLRASGRPVPADRVLAPQVLERLILIRLQLTRAERLGMKVDELTLTRAIERLAEQNKMDLPTFRRVLISEGLSYELFREDVRTDILLDRIRKREVEDRIQISEQEVDALLAQSEPSEEELEYRLAHIFIGLSEGATSDQVRSAARRIVEIRKTIEAGADFADQAVRHSKGRTALEGGELGWRQLGQLPPTFATLLRGMAPGDVSQPLRAAGGFHIVQLKETRPVGSVVQTRVRHILLREEEGQSENETLAQARQLRERIIAGEPFEEIASSYSQDSGSAARGGEVGWVSPGDLVEPFQVAMDALALNALSEPVRTRFGWHLIQPLERRRHNIGEERRRDQARKQLIDRRTEEETELWLQRLRDEAYVRVYPDA